MGNTNRRESRNQVPSSTTSRSQDRGLTRPMDFSHLGTDDWEGIPGGRRMRSPYTPNCKLYKDPEIAGALLDRAPNSWSFTYPCPNCSNTIWDGGLCKKITCDCGAIWQRSENAQIL
jgi:hypothetical protein